MNDKPRKLLPGPAPAEPSPLGPGLDDLRRRWDSLLPRAEKALFVREEDNVLVVRPNRVHHLNATACQMLCRFLRARPPDCREAVRSIAEKYGVEESRVCSDMVRLLDALESILSGKPAGASPLVRKTPFGTHKRLYPVLGEIALTYRCQNRCGFCYASSPGRGRASSELDQKTLLLIIEKMADQGRIGTLSFTGGEPTLRDELPGLIAHASRKGLWVNLITNGLKCSQPGYAQRLLDAGLDSAQVSLEGGSPEVHDRAVGLKGAFEKTVAGIQRLVEAGLRTHTNTTIHRENVRRLPELVDRVAGLGLGRLSMNMVIPTGHAAFKAEIGYREIGPVVLDVKNLCEERGITFVWYSPVPFCLFNPMEAGLGTPSCAAADGLLSVAPDGRILPCSSFENGLGNLVTESFSSIWKRRSARYWREKRFLPPVCKSCRLSNICCGACPLYWDEKASFAELPSFDGNRTRLSQTQWRVRRRIYGRQKGVGLPLL